MRRFGATGLRSERHAGRRLQPAECLSCRIGHRSKRSAKGLRTELAAEGRFGTKCGCCLVALTTAINRHSRANRLLTYLAYLWRPRYVPRISPTATDSDCLDFPAFG